MRIQNLPRLALLLTVSGTALIASAAWAQSSSPATRAQEATELSGVTITGQTESRQGYKVSKTLSAMKTDTALIDTPQSVSIVSLKQIQDQAAGGIGDAIRYLPGVFSAQGEGNRETLVFRGNASTGDFFVDGVRDDIQTYRDLYNIERLEIFRGPNAMIFGRGGVGGVVNRVTKMADWQRVREVQLEAGSFNHKRVQFNLGDGVDDKLALRLAGVYQNSDSYRDGVSLERWGFNPTAALRLTPDTLVQLGYEHFEDDRIADRGVPARYLPAGATRPVTPLRTPRDVFFGDPAASPTWTNTDALTLFVAHQISERVSIRNRTRYADYDKFYQNVFTGAVNAAETAVPISAYNNRTQRKNLINQTDLNADLMLGGVTHKLLVGAEFGRQETSNLRLEGRFAGGATTVTVPVTAPTINQPISWVAIASSGDNAGVTKLAAVYAQDQIALGEKVELVLGLRYERFNTKVTDRRTVGFPVGQQRDFDVTDTLWSPRVGVIYKPAANASLYASFSKTYLPRGGEQLTSLSISNQNLDPEQFKNYELGAKWDVLPGLNLAAAVFQLDRSNVLALSDPNNAASPTVPIGRQRTKGVELSATGQISDRVSLVGAYTYSDGTFRDNVSGTVKAGNQLANMPKTSASLWSRFEATDRLGLAAGVVYQGRRFASSDNLVVMPSYTRVDAAAYFKINDKLKAQVNAENLLGARYYPFAQSNSNLTPGSPTAVKVGLSASF
ncbi:MULTISPECIES: TonB-dependent siderophore receptor [Caulobacter]|jgi:catecholate siderophore receptor|uniref:TonB-dependent receptor n=1 Tax=Caulobacter TaxID=75 RepID=UPI000783373A|nr:MULTISPECIES: TonB-dependent siderophore receptor [Caulobacter]ATC24377.1 TonB-dependent siderophore receptor [Caulobacter vibrioides]MBQ1561718.1 TonB-dependent siderophore receptor [Caulobacter sp.]